MAKKAKKSRLDNVLTVREVYNILEYHEIKCSSVVRQELLRQSREERTVENAAHKLRRYVKAFFVELWKHVTYRGKFSKGAVKHGCKDL